MRYGVCPITTDAIVQRDGVRERGLMRYYQHARTPLQPPGYRDGERMGKVRSGVAALIEVFLNDVLRLSCKTEAQIRETVRIHVSEYEMMFRDAQLEERDKDLAARVCRALCRRSIIKEMAHREGTPTEAHLGIALGSIEPPRFSLNDR